MNSKAYFAAVSLLVVGWFIDKGLDTAWNNATKVPYSKASDYLVTSSKEDVEKAKKNALEKVVETYSKPKSVYDPVSTEGDKLIYRVNHWGVPTDLIITKSVDQQLRQYVKEKTGTKGISLERNIDLLRLQVSDYNSVSKKYLFNDSKWNQDKEKILKDYMKSWAFSK